MSVRAVAVHAAPRARIRVVPRELAPVRARLVQGDRDDHALGAHRWVRRWADDHQLIRLKVLMLAALVLLAMALEVPL